MKDGLLNEWMDGQVGDGWMGNGLLDGSIKEWMNDRLTDGSVNERMDR